MIISSRTGLGKHLIIIVYPDWFIWTNLLELVPISGGTQHISSVERAQLCWSVILLEGFILGFRGVSSDTPISALSKLILLTCEAWAITWWGLRAMPSIPVTGPLIIISTTTAKVKILCETSSSCSSMKLSVRSHWVSDVFISQLWENCD